MRNRTIATLLAAFSITASMPVLAEMNHGHDKMMGATASDVPSTQAFKQSNMTMHKNMTMDYSGNADVDFVRGMIAHHQGAVDMAKVELQYGQSPEMKSLAQQIVSSQEHEIAQMQQWLKAHSPK